MSELTMGIELEVRSAPVEVTLPDGEPTTLEPCFLHHLGGEALNGWDTWNKRTIANNELVELTLEVPSKAPTRAKIEFRTPEECTQRFSLFEASTTETLFVMSVLYRFIDARPTGATLTAFLEFYEDHCKRTWHRPLELVAEANEVAGKLAFLPRGAAPIVPRFAPQLTFSAPLERIPVLFGAPASTFHEPPDRTHAFRGDRHRIVTPRMLENAALRVASSLLNPVSGRFLDESSKRSARKLTGFLTLLFHIVLTRAFSKYINRDDVRSPSGQNVGTRKDNFRFLLRTNLDSLYFNGLTAKDRISLDVIFGDARESAYSMSAYLLEFCKSRLRWVDEFQLDEKARQEIEDRLDTWLMNFIARTFMRRQLPKYEEELSQIFDEAKRIEQVELGVRRKPAPPPVPSRASKPGAQGNLSPSQIPASSSASTAETPPRPQPIAARWKYGDLVRPVLEYRRLIGDENPDGYFSDAAEVAKAFEDLYGKLRWLESHTNPNREADETGSKAYYRPLGANQINWASTGPQTNLKSLRLEIPKIIPDPEG